MAVELEIEVGEKTEERIARAREMAHRGVWMGLGTFATIGDGVQGVRNQMLKLSDRLVERGESVEQGSREYVSEQRQDARKGFDKVVKDSEKRFNKMTKNALASMNLPSTRDVDSLNRKLNQLNRKLNELEKVQSNGKK